MAETKSPDVLVIGGGPAGLAAAEIVAQRGASVWIADQRPSLGRKFLMAGKSGLNLTKAVPPDALVAAVAPPAAQIERALRAFDARAVMDWAEDRGQQVFTGSSGRVFPHVMKASPLLRAILAGLNARGARILPRWRWMGGLGDGLRFETPEGPTTLHPRATILALGGASWARLGSDGAWARHFETHPFRPANVGMRVAFSAHMAKFAGQPVKNVALMVGERRWRGEFVVKPDGIEGGGVYAASAALRDQLSAEGACLKLDLFPDMPAQDLAARLEKPRGKQSTANHLRKTLGLEGVRAALVREALESPISVGPGLAPQLKALPLHVLGLRPLDEAISTAGGLPLSQLGPDLMLSDYPGVFAAGEMLDWEAPTGGYLITTCLATGRLAGRGALRWLDQTSPATFRAMQKP